MTSYADFLRAIKPILPEELEEPEVVELFNVALNLFLDAHGAPSETPGAKAKIDADVQRQLMRQQGWIEVYPDPWVGRR